MGNSEKALRSEEDFKKLANKYLMADRRITGDGAIIAALLDVMIIERLNSDKALAGILQDIAKSTGRIATMFEPTADEKFNQALQSVTSRCFTAGLNEKLKISQQNQTEIDQLKKDIKELKKQKE